MAKNAKKKGKFKPVEFRVRKADFKIALDNILKHRADVSNYFTLGSVVFQTYKPDNLTMIATDANTLLKVELPVEDLTGEAKIILNGSRLKKLRIQKDFESKKHGFGVTDELKIVIWEDSITIHDLRNNIQHGIPEAFVMDYPNVEKVLDIEAKKPFKFDFNPQLVARFAGLTNSKHWPCEMCIDTSTPTAQIKLVTEFDGLKFTGVFMPCVKREL